MALDAIGNGSNSLQKNV